MNKRVLEINGVPLAIVEHINRARTIAIARYEEDGSFDRYGYIKGLASEHGIAIEDAIEIAELLGAEEDFDGLITTLEDLTL